MKSNPACECSAAAGTAGAAYKSIYVPFDNSAHALRAVDLGLDSATAGFHDRLRGLPGAWEGARHGDLMAEDSRAHRPPLRFPVHPSANTMGAQWPK